MIFVFVGSTTLLAMTTATYSNSGVGEPGQDDSTSDSTWYGDYSQGYAGDSDMGMFKQTTSPDQNTGEITHQYAFGKNYFQTYVSGEGIVSRIAENDFIIDAVNNQIVSSGDQLLDVTVAGGQQNSVGVSTSYLGYTQQPGATDWTGSQAYISFSGLYDGVMVAPTAQPAPTQNVILKTGEAGDCTTINNCEVDGWEAIMPMCDGFNCTSSGHDTSLYLGNGVYSLQRLNWNIITDQTNDFLVYTITPFETALGTYPSENFEIQYKTESDGSWITLEELENTPISHKFQYRMFGVGENLSSQTPIYGFTPNAIVCTAKTANNATGDQGTGGDCDSKMQQDTTLYRKGNALIISTGISAEQNYTASAGDTITFDPSVHYYDNMRSAGDTFWASDSEADVGTSDSEWRIGVDRDGSTLYDYPVSRAGQSNNFNEYEIGDGWCQDNSVEWDEGNAGCRFSPLTNSNDHWDSNAPNDALASIPIFDTTKDFDGMVVEMAIDRGEWIQNGRSGWNDIHLELGLQAPAYHNSGSSTGTIKGWFETCFNGYVDIYIMPENDWETWYEQAYWQYQYSPYASSGYNSPNANFPSSLEWDIEGDNDFANYDEYWYDPGTDYNDDGYTRGPGDIHEMDETGSNYWKHPYSFGAGGFSNSAEMAINPFHYHHDASPSDVEGLGTRLFNDHFEDGGGAGTSDDAPGNGNQDMIDGTHKSSFNQVHDFWDINMYDVNDFPLGPLNEMDASSGAIGANGVGGPISGLALYHQKTIRLGSNSQDFCYDPISNTGTQRLDSSGVAIEPDSGVLLAHDSASGETSLNIEIGSNFYGPLSYASTRGTSELIDMGFLENSADTTMGFTMLIDVRNKNGPSSEACWADWSNLRDEVDDISSGGRDFCLDKNGWDSVSDRDGVSFNSFSSDTSCVSDEPASTQTGQNPDRAFWCGLNFETAFSDRMSIQLKAETAPFNPNADKDGDGVADTYDDCENTPSGATVDVFGCADQDGDGIADTDDPCPSDPTNQCNNQTPSTEQGNCFDNVDNDGDGYVDWADADCNGKGGSNDVDNDGVYDKFDQCDRLNGDGAAQDKSTYTQQAHADFLANPQDYTVDLQGCPQLKQGDDGDYPMNDCPQGQNDAGIYTWEDNDGDGRIDEDQIDGIDNDRDGRIDEDPLDDCLFDGTDVIYDALFPGSIEVNLESQTDDGYWDTHGASMIAENGSGASSGNGDKIYTSSYESSHAVLANDDLANDLLIKHDDWKDSRLVCNVNGMGLQQVQMRGYLSVWIANEYLEEAYKGGISNPNGDGSQGAWMNYGTSIAGSATLATSTHSSWAYTNTGNDNTLSSTATTQSDNFGISTDMLIFYPNFGEAYYKYECVATYKTTATGSNQVVNAQGYSAVVFTAIEMCEDGTSPTPAVPGEGVCSSSSGGSDLSESVSDFWDYLTDALLALGVLILIIAGAAVLYFTGREQQAIGLAIIGIGLTLALFVSNVGVEDSTKEVLGTVAHVAILAGSLVALMGMFTERTQFVVNSIVYSGFAFWFIIHTMSLMGSDDMMQWVDDSFMADLIVPAIPIVALLAAIATTLLAVLNIVLALNFVDEDSVWGEVATLGTGE